MEHEKINTIGKEFSMKELIKFVAAPVLSKLFMSLLSTLDDSLFISRYCGKNALAAFTIALPWFMLMDAIIMVICAVSTKCSMLMGEKKNDEAKSSFTSMVIIGFLIGCFFTLVLTLFREQILRFLGATDLLLPYILRYMNISRFYIPLMVVANLFSRFYVIAGKPKIAMLATGIQISSNLICDYVLIARLNYGIIGAAIGNFVGNSLLVLLGIWFYSNKKNEIHFAKPLNNPWLLCKQVFKLGRPQGLTSLAVSINCFVVNSVLLQTGGEFLVAAYTVVNNVQFMFMNAFFGFIGSVSPIVSYAYGERNPIKLSKIIKKATILIEILSVLVGLFIFAMKNPIIFLYFGNSDDQAIKDIVSFGMNVIPFCYGIFSFNVMVQEFSVAVGNHRVSTFLSVIENIIFANLIVLLLPNIFGQNAIWFVFLVTESLTLIFTCLVVYKNKDVYGYGKTGVASFIEN